MIKKVVSKYSVEKTFTALAVLAAVCFNNWILGFLLNRKLVSLDGSVSELSSAGQPHAAIFRSLDVLSGLVIAGLAVWYAKTGGFRQAGGRIIFWGALILGLANAADALMPLGCSVTLNTACSVPISLSLHHLVLPSHAYSSTAIGLGYLLLPLGGWIYASGQKLRAFLVVSKLVFALNLLFFASILHEYATEGITVKASGISQELQMLAVGLWIIAWGYSYKNSLHSQASGSIN